jgi:transcriptional regulator with XRE-family HTH domain
MSQRGLARVLDELGHPMSKDMLWKVEQGKRQLTADDLVALALALGVTPNRLLLPHGKVETVIELTPAVRLPLTQAWAWATGERPLELPGVPAEHPVEFRWQNRPQDVISAYSALDEDK